MYWDTNLKPFFEEMEKPENVDHVNDSSCLNTFIYVHSMGENDTNYN